MHITVSKTKQKLKTVDALREKQQNEIVQFQIKLSEAVARSEER